MKFRKGRLCLFCIIMCVTSAFIPFIHTLIDIMSIMRERDVYTKKLSSMRKANIDVQNKREAEAVQKGPAILEQDIQPQQQNGTAGEQLRRQQILREACMAMNYTMGPGAGMELTREILKTLNPVLVISDLQVLYCYVPKAGCTSWKTLMLKMVGDVNGKEGKVHERAERLFSSLSVFPLDAARYVIRNYHSFMFARNPFTRILSAYRDKMTLDGNDKWRTELYKWFLSHDPSIAHYHIPWRKNSTFADFVRFYLSSKQKNEHWKELNSLCHPCAMQYNFIGHFETIREDSIHLMKSFRADKVKDLELPWKQKVTNSSQDDTLLKYYAQLPRKMLQRLIQDPGIQLDMALFGYSVPDVIKKLAYGIDVGQKD